MSDNRVVWKGLDQLRAQLRALPAGLTAEASAIVSYHAEAAKADIVAGYPEVSGELRRRVVTEASGASRYGAGIVLISKAPHAHLYEDGTAQRFYSGTDELGRTYAHGDRGTMPKAPPDRAAIPKIIRWRVRMYAALAAMVERHGFRLFGSIGRAR